MKKFVAALLAASMTLALLAGCGAAPAAETETKEEAAETTEETGAADEFKSSILFCGSTSLYPIMSSLASSFTII